jgi:hypothetical protein
MTHDRHAEVLHDLKQELEVSERALAALQLRVDGLREATKGMEKLVLSERNIPSEASPDASPAPSPALPTAPSPALPAPPSPALPTKRPSTGAGALMILQSDTSRSWNPRQIWEKEVEREWVANTSEGRSAVRIALKRLHEKYPDQLERVPEGVTFAYRWKGDTNSNGHPALPGATAWHVTPAGRTDS